MGGGSDGGAPSSPQHREGGTRRQRCRRRPTALQQAEQSAPSRGVIARYRGGVSGCTGGGGGVTPRGRWVKQRHDVMQKRADGITLDGRRVRRQSGCVARCTQRERRALEAREAMFCWILCACLGKWAHARHICT